MKRLEVILEDWPMRKAMPALAGVGFLVALIPTLSEFVPQDVKDRMFPVEQVCHSGQTREQQQTAMHRAYMANVMNHRFDSRPGEAMHLYELATEQCSPEARDMTTFAASSNQAQYMEEIDQ